MAVGANTYGTVAGIQRLIGDIVESRTFAVGTVPSLVEVEAQLDLVAAEINAELDQAGYVVPQVSASWPSAYDFLKAINEYGAAAVLLGTVPAEVYDPDAEVTSGGTTRIQMYSAKFRSGLKRISDQKLRAGRRLRRLERVFAGSEEDEDGNAKDPFFTRGMHDYETNIETEEDVD